MCNMDGVKFILVKDKTIAEATWKTFVILLYNLCLEMEKYILNT